MGRAPDNRVDPSRSPRCGERCSGRRSGRSRRRSGRLAVVPAPPASDEPGRDVCDVHMETAVRTTASCRVTAAPGARTRERKHPGTCAASLGSSPSRSSSGPPRRASPAAMLVADERPRSRQRGYRLLPQTRAPGATPSCRSSRRAAPGLGRRCAPRSGTASVPASNPRSGPATPCSSSDAEADAAQACRASAARAPSRERGTAHRDVKEGAVRRAFVERFSLASMSRHATRSDTRGWRPRAR